MREKMDPGNWELRISGSNKNVGENIRLIDDSNSTTDPDAGIGGRVFNVVSGSITSGTTSIETAASSNPGGGFGLFYPDLGIILLNADIVNASASISVNTTSDTDGGNVPQFFNSIKGGSYFQARREEKLSSTHYYDDEVFLELAWNDYNEKFWSEEKILLIVDFISSSISNLLYNFL